MSRILIVDDDASIRETFEHHLSTTHQVSVVGDGMAALREAGTFDPDLVITDVRMPGMSGLELLAHLKTARPEGDVIVITAHEDMSTAINAMKAGAYDYLVKPLDLDHIDLVIGRCLRDRATRARAARLSADVAARYSLDHLVGRDPAMIAAYKLVGQVADSLTPVLVRGETGTGKELIARAIHFNSARASEPFVAVNCSAIPETLLESELFGHTRGAFTSAVSDRKGRFEIAGRGTLFLDEIGDTSPAFQSSLLRVLDSREFHPVGSDRTRRTEARVIAATHRDIAAMVSEGRFREDLYYRLRVVEIQLPPLRRRRADVPLLARWFVERSARDQHLGTVTISEAALNLLQAHEWPGNVRELENTLERAILLARGGVIGPEHIALNMDRPRSTSAIPVPGDDSLDSAIRERVERVLRKTGGNKRQACRLLGISRPTLDRLIVRHGLAQTAVTKFDLDSQEV
jgi:two-component system response regulator PilR (NtrC family)/two-component system response regulator HydG